MADRLHEYVGITRNNNNRCAAVPWVYAIFIGYNQLPILAKQLTTVSISWADLIHIRSFYHNIPLSLCFFKDYNNNLKSTMLRSTIRNSLCACNSVRTPGTWSPDPIPQIVQKKKPYEKVVKLHVGCTTSSWIVHGLVIDLKYYFDKQGYLLISSLLWQLYLPTVHLTNAMSLIFRKISWQSGCTNSNDATRSSWLPTSRDLHQDLELQRQITCTLIVTEIGCTAF